MKNINEVIYDPLDGIPYSYWEITKHKYSDDINEGVCYVLRRPIWEDLICGVFNNIRTNLYNLIRTS